MPFESSPRSTASHASSPCDWKKLDRMLRNELSNDESFALETHLGTCGSCQSFLETLHSEPHWWEAAKSSWAEGELPSSSGFESTWIAVEVSAEMPADCSMEAEKIELDFLERGSHPELLGRLGRYDVERFIGAGGMGVVLKAYDSELHRVVALKVLAKHLATNGAARRRFAREAQAAAAILHPNVIPIYNVETEGSIPFLVMQCVHGQSLQARVDRDGPLTPLEALRIAKQIAAGLAAAHEQGLVHRDVKPANILLEENVDRVLLSDFGLARAVDDASLTRTGFVAGTPHYMSPEQSRGESIGCNSDLFSLGSVIYFMLTGKPPFRAETSMGVLNRICHESHRPIRSSRPETPLPVCELVDTLLLKDPLKRCRTSAVVEKQIDSMILQIQSGKINRPTLLQLSSRLARQLDSRTSRWFAFAAGLAFLILLFNMPAAWIAPLKSSSHREESRPQSLSERSFKNTLPQVLSEDAQFAIESQRLQADLDQFERLWNDSSSSESRFISDSFSMEAWQLQESLESASRFKE